MHLTPEIFDSIDSFVERVRYVSQDFNENEFIKEYIPDYRFYHESLNEDAPGYSELCEAEFFEELAAKCLCNYNFYTKIVHYKNSIIKPCHIYELAYYAYIHYKLDAVYKPLANVSAKIINGVSFSRIPSEELECSESIMSEWSIADILFSINARTACGIIAKCDIDSSNIAELKKYVIRKDKDGFIAYIIENTINTFRLQMACALILFGKRIEQDLNAENLSVNEMGNSLNEILENPEIELPICLSNFYKTLLHHPENLSIENLISYIFTFEILIVQIVQHLKHFSTAVEAVVEFEEILQEHPEMDDSRLDYDDFKNGLIYNVRFPILEDFKQRFVCDTLYPPSVGKAKEPKSCYRYNEDKCRWKEDSILYLYHRLVEHGFLEWSEETLFSFMYRMCPEYKPQRSDPSPIIWNGDISTLWTLIYHFHGESIKMDNLTRTFFLMQNGSTFSSTAGGKHYTNSKNPQIMEILQDPMFAKS